jgi:acyl-[acyl-carrier-protein]-phospholipid O-acyltransferase / long-chain-fatty-acid--[acyl-carrier-protein] ligase
MVRQHFETELEFGPATVPEGVVAAARQQPGYVILQDTSQTELTYRRLLTGAQLLADQWRKRLGADEQRVGMLLPNVNALPVTLLSLWAAGRVPAILNYTSGTATLLSCAKLAGLKHVITSKVFVERAKLEMGPLREAGIEPIFLEDVRPSISGRQRILALLRQYLKPGLSTGDRPVSADSTAIILFTSGSEGDPKGVELTHRNLRANVEQMKSVIDIMDTDRFFNSLPLFHSFGLTVGLLLPLTRGVFVQLYVSPLHYRVVPSAFYNLNCTVFFGTNTFLNGYGRKADPFDFRTLRYLFAGAEKVQDATATLWMRKFGVRILEGYGITECSPCLSANLPMRPNYGSVGQFLPGIQHQLEPVEGIKEGGRLLVRGPNVMRGYLNEEANKKFLALGGWYDTGDIVKVDPNGYIFILGRLKRFAKVSGEMVSLAAVEEALANAFPRFGLRFAVALVARPDESRGEKLIAVTNEPKLTLEEIRAAVQARGLSNLSVPREIKLLHDLPRLSTGKINYRELEKIV